MNRRQLLLAACLFAVACIVPAVAQPAGKTIKFAQIADVHMVGFTVTPDGRVCPRLPAHAAGMLTRRYDLAGFTLPQALKQIREQFAAQFVVFTGDQADDGNGALGEADERQFKAVAEEKGAGLGLHFACGNHDGSQAKWSEIFGPLNYTFDAGDLRVVVLNSGSMNPDLEQESSLAALNELKQAIATAQGKRLIVFVHEWINPSGIRGMSMARAAEIKQALAAYPGTVAVMNGHIHSGGYSVADGIHYLTARAFCEMPLCYYTFELSADTLTVTENTWNAGQRAFAAGTPKVLAVRESAKAVH